MWLCSAVNTQKKKDKMKNFFISIIKGQTILLNVVYDPQILYEDKFYT